MRLTKAEIYQKVARKELSVAEAMSLVEQMEATDQRSPSSSPPVVAPPAGEESYPLSEGQKGLWTIYQFAPDNYAYNVPAAFRINQEIDIRALTATFRHLLERHPGLRVVIESKDYAPVQKVIQPPPFELIQEDMTGIAEPEILRRIDTEAQKPFNLSAGPLMRVILYRLGAQKYILFVNFHHIIFDGLSLLIFMGDLLQCYLAEKSGQRYVNPKPKSSYREFVYWQQQMLAGEAGLKHRNYWLTELAGDPPVLDLLTDKPYPVTPSYHGAVYKMKLGESLKNELSAFCLAHNSSMFAIMFAAFNVLLFRYTNQEDIVISTPTAARPGAQFADVIGYFSNLLLIRTNLADDPAFTGLLSQVGGKIINALEASHYPLYSLIAELGKNISKLMPICFAYQNWIKTADKGQNQLNQDNSAIGSLVLKPIERIHQRGEFNLTLEINEHQSFMDMLFKYNPDIFEMKTMERMATHYTEILRGIVQNGRQTISRINLLTPEEERLLLVEWNATQIPYPQKCIHD